MRLRLLVCLACMCLVGGTTVARAQAPLIFAVNEGVTYRVTPYETRERYTVLAELLGKTLKRPVKILPVEDYPTLRKNLESQAYDIAYIHPAHHSLRAMRDQNYRMLAITKGYTEYRASFLVKAGAPFKQPGDIARAKIVSPDSDSITAWMMRATLRDLGIDPKKADVGTTRYQDGIPFMLENGFYEVGVTASGAVKKEWVSKGGRILFDSRPCPIKHVVVSPRLSPEDADKVREVFLGLESSKDGQGILQRLGFAGFQRPDEQQMNELIRWLGI